MQMNKILGDNFLEHVKISNNNSSLLKDVIRQQEQYKQLTSLPLYKLSISSEIKKSFEPIVKAVNLSFPQNVFKDLFNTTQYASNTLKGFELNTLQLLQNQKPLLDMSKIKPLITMADFKKITWFKEVMVEIPNMNLLNPILEQLKNINFDHLSDSLNERQREFDKSLEKYDDLYWAVDEELWAALRSGECSEETIAEHVEENIDDYSNFFSSEDYYKSYRLIIEQAINSLKQEQYASATFNLFAVIDGNITKAFKEYEMEIEQRKNRQRKPKTFDKLKHYIQVEDNKDRLAFSFIFFKRVFNVYSSFFKPAWSGKSDIINRNLVMHGSYDYNEITKEDVLRLLQLVKATSILENITFKKEKAIS